MESVINLRFRKVVLETNYSMANFELTVKVAMALTVLEGWTQRM